ncbi:MAG TPA: LamG-like jellyroll fold domain-containing protein [Cyclobacteriaceae bacterium]|nr:LamG-like jellyroll fold domain-containing protein [Cyclobacteriaceae bacterium]
MKRGRGYFGLGVAAIALAVIVGSCKDDDNELPPIDGYNNSDEVASSNLVAHWTFDDTNNEVISSTAPGTTLGTTSFVTGKLGKALQLNKAAMSYPPITAINSVDALNNFTVSQWVKVTNTKKVAGAGFTPFFGIMFKDTDFWGNIQACAETGRHLPSSDTLELKNYMSTVTATGAVRGEDNVALFNADAKDEAHPNGQTGKWFLGAKDWVHYVMTWDATTHRFEIYANGEAVGGYTNKGDAPIMKMRVPAMAVVGSMAADDLGFPNAKRPDFAPLTSFLIDDIRVYNTTLAQKDVTALYNLGTAGR